MLPLYPVIIHSVHMLHTAQSHLYKYWQLLSPADIHMLQIVLSLSSWCHPAPALPPGRGGRGGENQQTDGWLLLLCGSTMFYLGIIIPK